MKNSKAAQIPAWSALRSTTALAGVALAIQCLLAGSVDAQERIWDGSDSGLYNEASNWNAADVPDSVAESATFGDLGFARNNVDLGGAPITVGGVLINHSVAGAYILNNGTLDIANGGSLTHSSNGAVINAIIGETGGAASLNKSGTGTLRLTADNTYSGLTSLTGGTIRLSHSNALGTATGLTDGTIVTSGAGVGLAYDAGIVVNETIILNGGPVTLAGVGGTQAGLVTGDVGELRLSGIVLAGANAYTGLSVTGMATFNEILNNDALGATGTANRTRMDALSTISYGNGIIVAEEFEMFAGSAQFHADAGVSAVQSGVISDTFGPASEIIKGGAGELTFSGVNTYDSRTRLANGVLIATSSQALGDGSATNTLQFSGGSLKAGGDIDSPAARGVNMLMSGSVDTNGFEVTFDGIVSGPGAITKNGAGTLRLNGANTYQGGTSIAGGTLSLGHSSAAGTGAITTTGSVIDYLSGTDIANPTILDSSDTQLQVLAGSATQSGDISELGGARPFEKIGSGELILGGAVANTYNGGTIITAGTLALNKAGGVSALGTGGVSFDGGILRAVNSSTIANEFIVNPGVSAGFAAADGAARPRSWRRPPRTSSV